MSRQAIGTILAGFFTVFIAYGIRYGYGMILPAMLSSLNISKTDAGVIYGCYFTAYTLFSPVVGVLTDRYDARLIVTVFTAMLAAGTFLMAFATSVFNASLFFVLAGIGHAACWTSVVVVVQRWAPEHRRGSVLAATTTGSQAGMVFWSLVLPFILGRLNWQAGWISMGCFAFCVAGLNFFLFRNPDDVQAQPSLRAKAAEGAVEARDSLLRLLKSPPLWFGGLAYMFISFTSIVPGTFLCVYATEKLHQGYAFAMSLITVLSASGIVGKVILGIASDHWDRVHMMMFCAILMGAGCWGMTASHSHFALYAWCAIHGLGFGAVWPIYAAAATDFFHRTAAGSVVGLWTVFLGAGSVLGSVICGWTIDATGGYAWAFNLAAASSVLSVLMLVPMTRVQRQITMSLCKQPAGDVRD